jgi:hypothetical protein
VALNGFLTFESLENAMRIITTTMSDCEFYEWIYATSTLASVTLQSKATTENFRTTLKSAIQQIYTTVSIFIDQAKQYFKKPKLIGVFNPFSVEFKPLLDDIINKEQTVQKLANIASMRGIQGKWNHELLKPPSQVFEVYNIISDFGVRNQKSITGHGWIQEGNDNCHGGGGKQSRR